MPKIDHPKKLNLFLRVPPETLAQVEAIAKAKGQKTVVLGREIMVEWAAQQQKTPAA